MKKIALLLPGTIIAINGYAQEKSDDKPNILFICIDDLRTQIGAYGHQYMVTPNLDRLASEGRLFTNQYVQVPTSGASRACMLTGCGAKTHKDINNFTFSESLVGSQEGESPETFVHHLRRNGYYTVGMGKVSHSDSGHAWHEGERIRELPYSWDKFVNDEDSPWPATFDALLHSYADGETRRFRKDPPAYEFLDKEDESYADGHLAQLAINQLESLATQESDKPFFMAVGFYKPHLPFCAPKKYWDMYEDTEIEISPAATYPEGVDSIFVHDSKECFNQYVHAERGGAGIVLQEENAKNLRRAYYSALTFTDAQVGKVLDKFYELGLDKNTIIILWGDHGWHLGDQTIWGKHSLFGRALNSTMIVRTPEMKQRGVKSDAVVGAIDIYPTICEYAGVTPPADIDGVSFAAQVEDPTLAGRDYIISYWGNMLSLKGDRYHFVLYKKGKKSSVMLFDHQNDPNETVNIAAQNSDLVKKFTRILAERNNAYLPKL